jgi:hypothetical protein
MPRDTTEGSDDYIRGQEDLISFIKAHLLSITHEENKSKDDMMLDIYNLLVKLKPLRKPDK